MKVQPAPFALRNAVGPRENYFIHDGYSSRTDAKEFDDTAFTDEFQREVYEYGRQVALLHNLSTVLDLGCGSGFKLITNFLEFDTAGIDLEPTVAFLRKRWPGRKWDTSADRVSPSDLVICADVIEHVANPDDLLDTIIRKQPKRVIISTPERDTLCLGTHDGPPKNLHHVREWNFSEFHAYIGSRFHIKQHFVINQTQCIECT
jgi:SAM-dependent methyltransferase